MWEESGLRFGSVQGQARAETRRTKMSSPKRGSHFVPNGKKLLPQTRTYIWTWYKVGFFLPPAVPTEPFPQNIEDTVELQDITDIRDINLNYYQIKSY